MIKLHKWKYKNPKKIFINYKKFQKLSNKNNVVIYDTRSSENFYKFHLAHSINVSPIKIREAILQNNLKTKIILVNNFERSNMSVASWARFKGYKKVFLFNIPRNFKTIYSHKYHKVNKII